MSVLRIRFFSIVKYKSEYNVLKRVLAKIIYIESAALIWMQDLNCISTKTRSLVPQNKPVAFKTLLKHSDGTETNSKEDQLCSSECWE